MHPKHRTKLNRFILAILWQRVIRCVQCSKAPPSVGRRRVGEDAIGIRLDRLRDHQLIGHRCTRTVVEELDFNLGIRHGLAIELDDPLEHVVLPQTERFRQGHDLGLQSKLCIPAFIIAIRGDIGLGIVDDERVFRRFPIGLWLHREDVGPRTLKRIVQGIALLVHHRCILQPAQKIGGCSTVCHRERDRRVQHHPIHLERVRKRHGQPDAAPVFLRNHRI